MSSYSLRCFYNYIGPDDLQVSPLEAGSRSIKPGWTEAWLARHHLIFPNRGLDDVRRLLSRKLDL